MASSSPNFDEYKQKRLDEPLNALPKYIFPLRHERKDVDKMKGKFWEYTVDWRFKRWRERNEEAVYNALQHPACRTAVAAIKAAGCDFNVRRHIAVEDTENSQVTSGYDPIHAQVVLSERLASSGRPAAIALSLAHELVHMLDQCRARTDFSSLEHLACTEVRAANLLGCTPKAGWLRVAQTGAVRPEDFGGDHDVCVKQQALEEMGQLRPEVPKAHLRDVINSVFDRCASDLEPFGRRLRMDSDEPNLVYEQRRNYGYY